MYSKISISNILIIISIVATVFATINPNIYSLGINNSFLNEGIYHIFIIQFFTGTFLHGGILHLLMNSVFIYYFGNIIEGFIGKNKYILFFIFLVFFNGLLLSIFSDGNTIGISGFCMALISYYTLELKSRNNPDYKGGFTAIIINILIGLAPGISLLGHLFGVIAGVIFYLINKNFFNIKWVGEIDIEKS